MFLENIESILIFVIEPIKLGSIRVVVLVIVKTDGKKILIFSVVVNSDHQQTIFKKDMDKKVFRIYLSDIIYYYDGVLIFGT